MGDLYKISPPNCRRKQPFRIKPRHVVATGTDADMIPDWTRKCFVCGASPIVPLTEMCGPCTWGEAATAGGKW